MIYEVSWTAFGHFVLDSHNFMVAALGLCVKQNPTLGAHAHPCPWVLGGHRCDIIGNIIGNVDFLNTWVQI